MEYIFVVASVNAILCESSKGMNIMELKRTETCLIYNIDSYQLLTTSKLVVILRKKKVVKAGINHLSFQTWTSSHPLHLPYF